MTRTPCCPASLRGVPPHARNALPAALAFAMACLGLRPARVHADEVTIPALMDTTLYENGDGLSNGRGAQLFAGYNSTGLEKRALVLFNVLAAIPPGSTITGVTLTLALSRSQREDTTISVHRVQSMWGEGVSIAPGEEGAGTAATDGDATWSHRMWPDVTWSERGGDFDPEPHAVTIVGDLGTYAWTNASLVADVQTFLDQPASNFGWVLIAGPDQTAKRFASRDNTAGDGPQLTVTFTPRDTTGACCLPDGSCGMSLHPGGSCVGTYMGEGSTCAPGTCAEVTGACCTPIASCDIKTRSECAGHVWRGANSSCDPNPCPVVLEPFVDALPRPAVATPIAIEGGRPLYRVRMFETEQQFHRDLPPTRVWGFHDGTVGGYPGPTFETRAGEPVSVIWENDLRDTDGELRGEHPLPIDTCIHGAVDNTPRTVVHLHGGLVPSEYDGQPDLTLLPGEDTRYEYPNQQRAATLWYHDHAVGITRLNVYMGLAGFYLLRDAQEDALGLPAGEHEIALAIQDRSFYPDGRLRYPTTWQETFFGEQAVVNGKVSPYLEVDRGKYRFRLLNGSTSRTYALALSDGRSFLQIGSDGGLLPESISISRITLGPGERADVVMNFEYSSPSVILKNSARSPFPGGGQGPDLTDIMKFIVTDRPGHRDPVPVKLTTIAPPDPTTAVLSRDLVIQKSANEHCGGAMWLINGLEWDSITEQPHLGTAEIWRFLNRSGVMHPMHMHALFFRVLDRQAFKVEDDQVVYQGEPSPPRRGEVGWKDTVQVGPFEAVRVLARFEDYEGLFPYHCHLLEHEDHGMMRQFEAIAVCGDGSMARGFEQCDDGNTDDGDGCDTTCKRVPKARPPTNPITTVTASDPLCSITDMRQQTLSWLWLTVAVLLLRRTHRHGVRAQRGCARPAE